MTDTATEDTVKAAATLEADTLQRAGQITLTQAKARIRDRQASPVAHLALQPRRVPAASCPPSSGCAPC
jgi:hypothetical protein